MELEKLSPALLRRAKIVALSDTKPPYRNYAHGGKRDRQATLFNWGESRGALPLGRRDPMLRRQVEGSLKRLRDHRAKWKVRKSDSSEDVIEGIIDRIVWLAKKQRMMERALQNHERYKSDVLGKKYYLGLYGKRKIDPKGNLRGVVARMRDRRDIVGKADALEKLSRGLLNRARRRAERSRDYHEGMTYRRDQSRRSGMRHQALSELRHDQAILFSPGRGRRQHKLGDTASAHRYVRSMSKSDLLEKLSRGLLDRAGRKARDKYIRHARQAAEGGPDVLAHDLKARVRSSQSRLFLGDGINPSRQEIARRLRNVRIARSSFSKRRFTHLPKPLKGPTRFINVPADVRAAFLRGERPPGLTITRGRANPWSRIQETVRMTKRLPSKLRRVARYKNYVMGRDDFARLPKAIQDRVTAAQMGQHASRRRSTYARKQERRLGEMYREWSREGLGKRRLRVKRESDVDRLHRETAEAAGQLKNRDKLKAAVRRHLEARGSDYGYTPGRAYE